MNFLFQEKDKPNSTTMNGSPGNLNIDQMGVKIEPAETECLAMSGSNIGLSSSWPNDVKAPSPEQEELISSLVFFQGEFEHPNEEEIKKITVGFIIILLIKYIFINYCIKIKLFFKKMSNFLI